MAFSFDSAAGSGGTPSFGAISGLVASSFCLCLREPAASFPGDRMPKDRSCKFEHARPAPAMVAASAS